MKYKVKMRISRLFVTVIIAALIFCMTPLSTAFAAKKTTAKKEGVVVTGKTKTIDGDITTTKKNARGLIAKENAKVTVNGDITTNGEDSYGIYADQSTVTAQNVTAAAAFSGGIYAENGASVTAKKVTSDGEAAHAVQVTSDAKITANSVSATGYGAEAVVVTDKGTLTAGSVTAKGKKATAVGTYGSGSADITKSVTGKGADAIGVNMAENPTGTVRVGGNVRAPKGYGAVIQMVSAESSQKYAGLKISGHATLVVDGTLSGADAPLAIMPYYYTTQGNSGDEYHYIYDLDAYQDAEYPTITVGAMKKGNKRISIVEYGKDGKLVEKEGAKANALRKAISQRIQVKK